MPKFITRQHRTALPPDTRPRLPAAPGPQPARLSREDTIAELRAIYKLLESGTLELAKTKLVQLGRNLSQP